jgi:DNA-binding response OmpR family regulator
VLILLNGQKNPGDRSMKFQEILLVDGKTPMMLAIGFILESNGYLVMLAPDAGTAAAELDNYCFDLMLVYLTGHEKDKLALLRQARLRSPRTKIMVVGNPRNQTPFLKKFQTDIDDYLLAPFTAPDLCRRVDRCLQKISTSHIKVRPRRPRREISKQLFKDSKLS